MMLFKPENLLRSPPETRGDGLWEKDAGEGPSLAPNAARMGENGAFNVCLFAGPESSPPAQGHPQRYQGTERPAD